MRSFSLALIIALLVGPCVIATPLPSTGNQNPPAGLSLPSEGAPGNQETTPAEGEQRAPTPQSQAGSEHSSNPQSDTTLGADNFDPNDIDRSQSGWARLKTKHYDKDLRHIENPTARQKHIQDLQHLTYVAGSSKSTGKLYTAPLTSYHQPGRNNRYVPGRALDYMTGNKVDENTKVHTGVPFRRDPSKVHMLTDTEKTEFGMHMTKEQEDKFHEDMANNIRNPPVQPEAAQPPAGRGGRGGQRGGGGGGGRGRGGGGGGGGGGRGRGGRGGGGGGGGRGRGGGGGGGRGRGGRGRG